MKIGYAGRAGRFLSVAGGLCVLAGCATPDERLEVRWYTPASDVMAADEPGSVEPYVEIQKSHKHLPPLASATKSPDRAGDYTVYALPEGHYDFSYLLPTYDDEMLYGEIDVYEAEGDTVQEFVRRTFVTVSPGRPGGDPGLVSILTEEDLDRVRHGDMVTKVVFVADLRAIDRRLDMIEAELRHIRDLEARLTGQLEYWKVKLADRRRNALYNSEYGVDIPSAGLASAQAFMGAETYHWYRYTQAEDKVRTYEEEIARLELPAERLREERAALRGMLTNAKVVYRRNEMMLATFQMQRRYFDMDHELEMDRATLQGPKYTTEAPYGPSGAAMSLGYLRGVETNTKMKSKDKQVGEIVMIIRLGPRVPVGR